MGIKGLMKLLSEAAPESYKTTELQNYMGRVVAIDASMQLYQFMVMVRTQQSGGPAQQLMNDAGEVTSHLQGFFTRTIRLMEKGIKPVYVFDGKPPELKAAELAKRRVAKTKAAEELKKLEDGLDQGGKEAVELVNKAQKRTVSVTKEHNEDVQKLLQLMGIPIVLAPCEAEAQCAELCKKGKVWATATEDMDALTFGTPILLRNLTYAESRKLDVYEVHYDKILKDLDLTPRQFVDLCILCGCDYSQSIKGLGPKTALKLIKEHKSFENIAKSLDSKKFSIPEELTANIDIIRGMFEEPDVTDGSTFEPFKWEKPKHDEVIKYLVDEKQFDIERVSNALKRLEKSKEVTSQRRMDSFFKPVASSSNVNAGFKRKKEAPVGRQGKGVKKGKK